MTQTLDIYGPINQAQRCLDAWLAEEGRSLPKTLKIRASALMARYFLHEDDVNDALMMSFLRHYSGRGTVDLEDISSVKTELKTVLDKSTQAQGVVGNKLLAVFVAGVFITAFLFFSWHVSHKKITQDQQAALKAMVEEITVSQNMPHAAVWAKVKEPLDVRSYQDISWWDYDDALEQLEKVKNPMSFRTK